MSRKKTGRGRPETFTDIVAAEEGQPLLSSRAAAKKAGIGVELLVGLAQRGKVEAITRVSPEGHKVWFFTVRTVELLVEMTAKRG